jgi:thiol-disulfide isomerase/thioredoxin
MKQTVSATILAAFVFAFSFAADDQLATFSTQKPKIGEVIGIAYNSAFKGATLIGVKQVTAEVLVVRSEGTPLLREVPLKAKGKLWNGEFRLDEEKGLLLLVKFVSGDKIDDNGENVWNVRVVGDNGTDLKGSHLALAQALAAGNYYGFKISKDAGQAMKECKIERMLYPESVAAVTMLWGLEMRSNPGDETKAKIAKELDEVYAIQKENSDNAAALIGWYARLGKKETADSLQRMWCIKEPRGKVAEGMKLNAVYSEKDAPKRAEMLEQYLKDFPQKPDARENYENTLIYFQLSAKNFDKAAALLAVQPNPSSNNYNSLAWAIIEKGERGPELEKAVAWAKQGIDLLKAGKERKPSFMSDTQWKKSQMLNLGMITDTYAFGLFKLGKTKEAEDAYAEAVKLTEGKQDDINERYVDAIVANGGNKKVLKVCEDFVRKGMMSDKLLETYKTAYIASKGSEKGFDELVKKVKTVARDETKKKIMKERVNKPAVEFALKDIQGNLVKLSDLRGKVVVVDFWATWCGPCKASFPYLQKVYDKYKENTKVAILALNTWENESGAKQEELVKKFMAENKYTFPVLYDEGFVEKYGVEGIPTKFIIDKKGNIQFRTIGFDGPKMVDEMILQIDILLSDEFYSMK